MYVHLWPALATNVSLGNSIGVPFHPKVTVESFEGWGLGFGVSGGPPNRIFHGGVDMAFSEGIAPKGRGISGAIGFGAPPGDISAAVSHASKLWSTPLADAGDGERARNPDFHKWRRGRRIGSWAHGPSSAADASHARKAKAC